VSLCSALSLFCSQNSILRLTTVWRIRRKIIKTTIIVIYSPNSITPTFTETSLWERLRTQIMKVTNTNDDKSWNHEVLEEVMNTNHHDMSRCLRRSPWQVCDKPICIILMEFSSLLCTVKAGHRTIHESPQHKSCKSAAWFVSQIFVICVCYFPCGEVLMKVAKWA